MSFNTVWSGFRRCGSPAPAASLLLLCAAGAQAQVVTNIGALQPTHQFSQANAVSADGSVVACMSGVQFWQNTASFRWTSGGGTTDVGNIAGGLNVIGGSVSANGQWLGGTVYGNQPSMAFRWSQGGGIETIGYLPAAQPGSEGNGISGDGSVMVGNVRTDDGDRAFRWTSGGGMQSLGTLGGAYSWGLGISANAQVITGVSATETGESAFMWTQSGGMQMLPLIDGETYTAGIGVSADGSVIVGYSGLYASRWVNGVGATLGAAPGGTFSIAYAVSGDGLMVGGLSDNAGGDTVAMIWTEQLGMVDLNSYLPSLGIDLTGWNLSTTTGISSDGTTIVGAGSYQGVERGWVVTIPTPGAAALLTLGGLAAGRRRRA